MPSKSNSFPKSTSEKDKKIIERATKNIASWYSYFSQNNDNYRDDKRFAFGEQWYGYEVQEQTQLKKPTLTIDKIGPIIRKLMGQQKNAHVEPIVIPQDEEITQDKIDLLEGILKKYLYDSHASEHFAKAYESALTGGYGVLQVYVEYENPNSFDLVYKVRAIAEPLNTFFDPVSQQPTKFDGMFCGQYEIMQKDLFEKKYPGRNFPDNVIIPVSAPFYTIPVKDVAVVVDYYEKSWEDRTIVKLSNELGYDKTCLLSEVDEETSKYYASMISQGYSLAECPMIKEVDRRLTQVVKIMCYKLTALEILDSYEWYCDLMPYIFLDGDSMYIDGKQYIKSFLTTAKDAQRLYNYTVSEIANGLKTSRKEKILMTKKQIDGYEQLYTQPERVQGALLYNNSDPGAPPPMPIPSQDVSESFFQAALIAGEDIAKVLGMMDPMTGGRPDGASGIAVSRTIENQSLTAVNWLQNLYGAIEQVGRIGLKLTPKIFDSRRTVTIENKDRQLQTITINDMSPQGHVNNDIADITSAIADVQIEAGMSFETQKQLTEQRLTALCQIPEVMPYIIDLVAREMNIPISKLLEQRLKYVVPKYVLDNQPAPPPQPNPEVQLAQAKIQADMQMNQQKMQQSQMTMQMQQEKLRMDMQIEQEKMQIQQMQMRVDAAKSELEAATELEAAQIDARAEIIKATADLHKSVIDTRRQISG